jgi:hypothetical protein
MDRMLASCGAGLASASLFSPTMLASIRSGVRLSSPAPDLSPREIEGFLNCRYLNLAVCEVRERILPSEAAWSVTYAKPKPNARPCGSRITFE